MTWMPFENLDDAFARMAAAEEAANARITDEQRLIQRGDYVIKVQHLPFGERPYLVLGETWTPERIRHEEGRHYTAADGESLEEALAGVEERWGRGYLFGRWFSLIEPQGELSDCHVSTLIRSIPKQLFDMLLDMIQHGVDPLEGLKI